AASSGAHAARAPSLHDALPILGASPDGLCGPDGGWESKSPKPKTHIRTVLEDRVPPVYMPQGQACLLAFQRDWWDFTSYVPGLRSEEHTSELQSRVEIVCRPLH